MVKVSGVRWNMSPVSAYLSWHFEWRFSSPQLPSHMSIFICMCHMSYVTCHVSLVMYHMPTKKSFFSLSFIASRLRICYQRGPPRLVLQLIIWTFVSRSNKTITKYGMTHNMQHSMAIKIYWLNWPRGWCNEN